MAEPIAHTVHQLATGATFGGGLAWLTTNSSALTAMAVISTALASMYFGIANKNTARRNAIANEERNKISRRNIIEEIVSDLSEHGKGDEYIKDFIKVVRK